MTLTLVHFISAEKTDNKLLKGHPLCAQNAQCLWRAKLDKILSKKYWQFQCELSVLFSCFCSQDGRNCGLFTENRCELLIFCQTYSLLIG